MADGPESSGAKVGDLPPQADRTTKATAPDCATYESMVDAMKEYAFVGGFSVRGFEPLRIMSIKFYEAELLSKQSHLWLKLAPYGRWTPDMWELTLSSKEEYREKMLEIGELLAKHCMLSNHDILDRAYVDWDAAEAIKNLQEMVQRTRTDEDLCSDKHSMAKLLSSYSGWTREFCDPTNGYGMVPFLKWPLEGLLQGHISEELSAIRRGFLYNLRDLMGRLAMAVGGGSALLLPMIVMTFLTSQTARLLIVCSSVLGFSTLMACTAASKENIVAATAAYAAVMVVYIGSASPS